MEVQQVNKYIAADIEIKSSILKQVDPIRKKILYEFGEKRVPIIIDYGSQTIKVGYQQSNEPQLVFRPYISKNRDPNKSEGPIKQSINTSYEQLDIQKVAYKSAFERNIILHFSLLQQCNDYIFSQLIKPYKQIKSQIIISQPFGNPIHCRDSLLQQYFQCYQIESVLIGVDSLFAYFYELNCNWQAYTKQTSLIIDIGASATHIFTIIEGKINWSTIRRINIGTNNTFELFAKTVVLKNPQLKNKLTYPFLKHIYQNFTQIAIDYKLQIKYFRKSYQIEKNNIIYRNRIQQQNKLIKNNQDLFINSIQIDFQTIVQVPQQEIKRKQEIKKRMSEKLKQTISRRKQLKKKLLEKQLKDLQYLEQKYHQHDKGAHQQVAELFGQHHPYDKLLKKIKSLSIKLGLIQQIKQQKKFPLIDIPDNQLPPQKIKYKKMQIYQKNAMEARIRKQKQKQQQQIKMKQLREYNPQEYLSQLRQKYQKLAKKVKENQRIKNQLNNRKSRLKQRKMQVLVRLAQDQLDDNFGENQDDWLVYKQAQDSDHFSQMEAMEVELREIDPEWMQTKKDIHHLNSSNQLFLVTQLVKCNEALFQPKICGVNQSGLIETIISILSIYPQSHKERLLSNIYVVGGGSQIRGLKARIYKDLRRQCPIDSQININISKAGWQGAYLAMKDISKNYPDLISKMSYQRSDYFKNNNKINFVENPWSNPKPNI